MRPAYAASKAGVSALTRHISGRWGEQGIRCNAVAPGIIDTEMGDTATSTLPDLPILLGRHGTPEECAAAVVFLASEESSYVTGAVLNLSGGLFLDR